MHDVWWPSSLAVWASWEKGGRDKTEQERIIAGLFFWAQLATCTTVRWIVNIRLVWRILDRIFLSMVLGFFRPKLEEAIFLFFFLFFFLKLLIQNWSFKAWKITRAHWVHKSTSPRRSIQRHDNPIITSEYYEPRTWHLQSYLVFKFNTFSHVKGVGF